MGIFSDDKDISFGKDISDFKDFGYNQLHTNREVWPGTGCYIDPYTDDERCDALKPIYKEVVGKDIDKSSIVHLDNRDNHTYNAKWLEYDQPGKIAFVGVNVDQQMVDHMNETLAKDNPLRAKINTDGDNKLSMDEMQKYFDKIAVKGYSIPHYNNNPANPSFSFSQSEDTGKISHFDMENIYALKNNAIIKDALFAKYNGDGSFDTNAKLSYDEIKDKSIISESDFHKLDVAGNDCVEKGVIGKDVFDKFEFDKNGDHVIDKDGYAEGMQKVDKYLKERADTINNALNDKECNNEGAKTHLPKKSIKEVS